MKILNEPIADYHKHEAVSSSKLDTFHDSPLRYFQRYVAKTLPGDSSFALDFGQGFHALQDSREAFDACVVLSKYHDFRTGEAQLWRDAQATTGKLILKQPDIDRLMKMDASVKADPIVTKLLQGTESEVTWRMNYGKFSVQCRTDRWNPVGIELFGEQTGPYFFDWKTVPDLDDFRKNILKYGYARQKVFYQEVLAACLNLEADDPRPRGYWVVVESEPPHEVMVAQLGVKSTPVARGEVYMDLRRLKRCYETNEWKRPAVIEPIDYPGWYVAQAEQRLLEQRQRLELEAGSTPKP